MVDPWREVAPAWATAAPAVPEDIAGSTPGVHPGHGDEHAPGLVAVGAPDGSISAPTRRANSAGASSMIESDSISVSDVARAV